jgi:DNA-binding transcriptional LysR family regulator
MIDLRFLKFAVSLDQHRNFGRAALATGTTQPSFSRGIASLEATLGTRLFDRTNRRVEPTPAGVVFLARARSLLAEEAAMHEALDNFKAVRSGHVRIGAGPYPLDISIIECVARLAARHPLLQVELLEGQWRDFAPRLLAGEVDVAVMESSIVAADSRFRVEPLPAQQGLFFCRSGHPLAKRRNLTLAEILEFPLVGVRLPVRALPPAAVRSRGLVLDPTTGDMLPRITTTSVAASRTIVRRTNGIGLGVRVQLAEDVRQGRLVILDFRAATLKTNYGITYLRDRSLSPGAVEFIATLKGVEAEIAARSTAEHATVPTAKRKHRSSGSA